MYLVAWCYLENGNVLRKDIALTVRSKSKTNKHLCLDMLVISFQDNFVIKILGFYAST